MAGYLDMVRKWEQSRHGPDVEAGGDAQDCLGDEGQLPEPDADGSPACSEQASDCGKSWKSEIRIGVGQPSPLDRPPQMEPELRRLMTT